MSNHNDHPTPPSLPPELPPADRTRFQETGKTEPLTPPQRPAQPPYPAPAFIPPPPSQPPQRPAYTVEKQKPGTDHPLRLPVWSVLFTLLTVAFMVSCVVLAVLALGGRTPPPAAPRFVILTARPQIAQEGAQPLLLVTPTFGVFTPPPDAPPPVFALSGPTLEPVVLTPTPTPRPAIGIGSTVAVVSSSGVNLRQSPGIGAARARPNPAQPGEQFIVIEGPQPADNLTWWKVRSLSGDMTAWIAENDGTADLIAALTP
jgi:hypothetical protein